MKENKSYRPQEDIALFMRQFEQEVKQSPELPGPEILLLRARLVFEEALEFVKGCGCTVNLATSHSSSQSKTPDEAGKAALIDDLVIDLDPHSAADLVEYVDGCIDQLVVTYGALNAAGVNAQPAWDEVQRSNMSKAWPHCSVCDAILERGQETEPAHPGDAAAHQGHWNPVLKVHKRPDGKVIKSPLYSPADLKRVIEEQAGRAGE